MDLNDCLQCVYFELRGGTPFLWILSTASKLCFEVKSYVSSGDFIFEGNSRLNTRNVLSFDNGFDFEKNSKIKKALIAIFNTPSSYRKVERYIDRILQFSIAGNDIIMKVFTLNNETKELIEVGPHLVLCFEELAS